jgi:hypothetical protein
MSAIKVYNITSYKNNSKEAREKLATSGKIEFITQLLENNKQCYHEITQGENVLILHGDLDFKEQKNENIVTEYGKVFIRELNKLLNEDLNVNEDFKYTINSGKVDKKTGEPCSSFHWSIPKISMLKYQQKYLVKKIHNDNYKELENAGINVVGNGKGKDIDEGIYKSDSLFRLPNQLKMNIDNTEHKIVKGEMKDFITQYIENSKLKEFTETVEDIEIVKKEKLSKTQNKKIIEENQKCETVGFEDIVKLFIENCYSMDRRTDYNEWINFGICLKNSFNTEIALKLFNDFSKTSSSYQGFEDIKKSFENIKLVKRDDGLTSKSLYFWAKKDNEEEYKKIIQKDKFLNLENLMTNKKIGNLVFEYAKNKFLWKKYNVGNKINWVLYYFNGMKWIPDAKINFKNYIANELKSNLEDLYVKPFLKKIGKGNLNSDEEENLLKLAISNSKKLLKLEDNKFLNDCYEASKDENECIDVEFNENPYLLGFNNGVWDLKNGIFRKYQYNDFITYSTGWDLNYDFENNKIVINDEKLKEVENVIKSIHPEDDEQDFYLSILASCLDGIAHQKFFMFVGYGRNGKGLINDYLLRILGDDYSCILDQSVLSTKSKGGANPQLAKISRKRFINSQEPDKGTILNLGLIKELTGGSQKIDARMCNSNDTNTYLNGTLIYQCNEKPSFGDAECGDAEYERFEILEFKQTYTNEKDKVGKINKYGNQMKYGNPLFKSDEWRDDHKNEFFYILSNSYNKFRDNNFIFNSTKNSKEATKSYLATSKIVLSWFYDNYEYVEFTKEDAKNGLKRWYIDLNENFEYDFKETEYYKTLHPRAKGNYNTRKYHEIFKQEEHYKDEYSVRLEKGQNPVKLRHIMINYRKKEFIKFEDVKENEEFDDLFI